MEADEIDKSDYGRVGWYHVTEVERLFKSLEADEIRFYFEIQETGIAGADSAKANFGVPFGQGDFGGSFGQGSQFLVFIHSDDQEKFEQTYKRTFEPEEGKIDWRKNLRGE